MLKYSKITVWCQSFGSAGLLLKHMYQIREHKYVGNNSFYSYFSLLEFASPASEISTVPHPSSADKSIPSTMLTSRGLSSISSSGNFTGNDGTASAHTTTNSTRSLRQKSSAEMTPLGTIPEQSYGELEFPLPTALAPPLPSQQQSRSIVRADVHRQQEFAARNAHLQATTGNFITHILKINTDEKFDEKVDERKLCNLMR